ncbi:MAG: universal stress protein [Acidobacteriota bacterium]
MAFFKRILFPVDLSEASERMAPYVKKVVNQFEAELHIIYVKYVDQYYLATFVNETMFETTADEESRIRKFVDSNFEDLNISTEILQGPPGTEIVRYSEEQKMDLIVMGHNSTGLLRAAFGSVAGYVVKHSQVPVLIISPNMLRKKKSKHKSVA